MRKILQMPIVLIISLFICFKSIQAETQYGISMHGDLKYKLNQAFDYVKVGAPKGGAIRLAAVGTFNSLNPFINKGIAPTGLSVLGETLVFETLMKRSADEPFSLYGLIAEKVELAPDRSWITFQINPQAKWPDGRPITADDVEFSYQTLRDFGRMNMRLFYAKVARVDIIDTHTIKFTFKPTEGSNPLNYDPEAPLLIALLNILPKHELQGKDFEKVYLQPIMGSGPYKIAAVDPGKKIVYQRRPDYWGRDLAVNTGQYNFDTVTYDYYRDQHVAFEAFKAHAYDIRMENDTNLWHSGYNFSAKLDGQVKTLELVVNRPTGMHAFAFNTRRPIFSDLRVRRAINYAFDFNWINEHFLHNSCKCHFSYYQNSELAHLAQPTKQELTLLKQVAPAELDDILNASKHDAIDYKNPAELRRGLARAKELLKDAGWQVDKHGKLRNQHNDLFTFEILLYDHNDEKIALSLARNLKTLGIDCKVRVVDAAQYESRRLKFDYDMIINTWGQSHSPGNEQAYYWGSSAADQNGSRNYCGIKSASVDKLCVLIANAKDRPALIAAGRALDRLLINSHYVIPLYYKNRAYLAYWDQFKFPSYNPKIGVRITTWWAKAVQ